MRGGVIWANVFFICFCFRRSSPPSFFFFASQPHHPTPPTHIHIPEDSPFYYYKHSHNIPAYQQPKTINMTTTTISTASGSTQSKAASFPADQIEQFRCQYPDYDEQESEF